MTNSTQAILARLTETAQEHRSVVDLAKEAGLPPVTKGYFPTKEKEEDKLDVFEKSLKANGFVREKAVGEGEYVYDYKRGSEVLRFNYRASRGLSALVYYKK